VNMTEEITSVLKMKKTLRKRDKYLTINISETEALSLGVKEGDSILIERLIEIPASEVKDEPYDDMHTYSD